MAPFVLALQTGIARLRQPPGTTAVVGSHAVNVEVVRSREVGVFAACPVDKVGSLRLAGGVDVDLLGDEEFLGSVRELPQDGLAADDDELGLARDGLDGPERVLELLARHDGQGLSARSRDMSSGDGGGGGFQPGGDHGGGCRAVIA